MIPRQKLDYESKILRAKNNTKIIPSQKQGYENENPSAKAFRMYKKSIVFESVYVCNKRIKSLHYNKSLTILFHKIVSSIYLHRYTIPNEHFDPCFVFTNSKNVQYLYWQNVNYIHRYITKCIIGNAN